MLRSLTDAGRIMLGRPGPDEPPFDVFLRASSLTVLLLAVAGGAWGFERGLSYLPTVGVAVVEGGVVFATVGAVPAALVGVAAAAWQYGRRRG